jgi:CheY-like chemotaxis protein
MPSIAIIDDRQEQRDTIKLNVEYLKEDGWNILDISPLPELADYPSWIGENNVAVILLDERLNEQASSNYQGHDLVAYIRKRLPTLPIFIITSYSQDPDLLDKFKDVEEILQREVFTKKAEEYVPRFMRAGQRFVEVFEKDLSELSDKATRIAKGSATLEDVERVKAIQSKMDIAYSDTLYDKSRFIEQLNDALSEFNKLKSEIKDFLES